MNRRIQSTVSLLLTLIMICCCVTVFGETAAVETAPVAFAGGTGTADDPWQIETAQQLLAINNDLTANYLLMADIDLSAYDNWPMIGMYVMDENSEEGEDPVPEYAFSGVFDGNGHTISNLTIDASEDFVHMLGVGLFACVGEGGAVKNLTVQDYSVSGMMLVGGVVGYAFHCTVDNVHVTASNPAEKRNTAACSLVMVGGIIGGLTLSECTNSSIEYTDILAAPGGNSGALGGGFSKPVLENCSVEKCTVTAALGEVPMFGMTEGQWIGGLTGCVNLDDYDTTAWYVKNCQVKDTVITVSGQGAFVGGLTGSAGSEWESADSPRALFQDCTVQNVQITITDAIPNVGGLIGGSFSEGGPYNAFRVDDCTLQEVTITTAAVSLAESATGRLIGLSSNCQAVDAEGNVVDLTNRDMDETTLNSTVSVSILSPDGVGIEDADLIGLVLVP